MSITERQLDRLEERIGERLAARKTARTNFTAYKDRPLDFMREVLRFEPWGKQAEVIESVRQNKRTVVMGHHGAGKDAVLAALLLWAAYARTMKCLAISATERQLIGQLWAEVARLWGGADLPGELFVGELRVGGEKRIVGMTSGSTSNLTGWHSHRGTGVFVAISESQAEQVGAAAFDAAEGNTAGEGSRIAVVGNPVKPAGRFYEVSRKPTWKAITISAFDHPNVREGRVIIPGGPAPGWPAEMAAEYGTDSAFYVSRVLGEFPTQGSVDSLIRPEWLEAAFARHDAEGPELALSPLPLLALDVARSWDRDENVTAVCQGPAVRSLHPWRSRNLVATADRFLEVADATALQWFNGGGRKIGPIPTLRLVVDTPGVGGGVVDTLRAPPRNRACSEWWGWNPAPDRRRFSNLRSASHWNIRKLLEDGRAILPRDERLREDLLALEWSENNAGQIQMLSKEDLRKVLGRSPDRSDPVVVGLYHTTGGGNIARVRPLRT